MYGVADDDAHTFKSSDPRVAGPGRGWVYVHAAHLEAHAILEALERGDFYASTGVELSNYQVTQAGMTVEISPTAVAHLPRAVHRPEGPRARRGDVDLRVIRVQRERRVRARQDPGLDGRVRVDPAGLSPRAAVELTRPQSRSCTAIASQARRRPTTAAARRQGSP